MSEDFFARHKALLDKAVEAIHTRGYWSPFPEIPSPKTYGETANDDGKKAFEALLNTRFPLDQPATVGETGSERSPFGIDLGINFPVSSRLDEIQPRVITSIVSSGAWMLRVYSILCRQKSGRTRGGPPVGLKCVYFVPCSASFFANWNQPARSVLFRTWICPLL